MKFKLDENMPQEAVTLFRLAGHDACTVVDQGLLGATDRLGTFAARSSAQLSRSTSTLATFAPFRRRSLRGSSSCDPPTRSGSRSSLW